MAIFHLTHILVPLRKIEGESFGKKDRYPRTRLRQQVIAWRRSWATLANRHLKRYGHKAAINARSLKAQGSKRKPSKHRGPQPKARRKTLDAIRPPQPRSPIVRTTKQSEKNGGITLRAIITHSALSKIGTTTKSFVPALTSISGGGWPAAAIADWKSWGHRETARFFAKWPELGGGYSPIGGLNR